MLNGDNDTVNGMMRRTGMGLILRMILNIGNLCRTMTMRIFTSNPWEKHRDNMNGFNQYNNCGCMRDLSQNVNFEGNGMSW